MGTTNFDSIALSGGMQPAGGFMGPSVYHTGGVGISVATSGTDTTPVVTETYLCRVFIECNASLSGISILNGSAVAGNIKLGLFNTNGVLVAETASTAASGTAAYQQVPFTSPVSVVGPANYYIALQSNNTGYRFRSHALGNFGAFKQTGQTFGTWTNPTIAQSFTANVGPIADTYGA